MLRSRVALAIIGVLIFGGVGASLGVLSTARPSFLIFAASPATSDTSTTQTGAPSQTAGATTTATPPGGSPTAAANPTATATRTPRPTPTPLPQNVQLDVHGSIISTDPGTLTFVLRISGVNYTVQTKTTTPPSPSDTAYTGTATNFAGLQPGWRAEVHGVIPLGGSAIVATEVNAQPGDN